MAAISRQDLAELPRDVLADEAWKMRVRAQRVKANGETFMSNVRDAVVGGGAAWGLGWFMGTRQLEYDRLVAEKGEEAAKAEDPRLIVGLPIDFVLAAAVWGVGISGIAGKRMSPFLLAAGQGGLNGFLYGWGQEIGLTADDEDDEEAEAA